MLSSVFQVTYAQFVVYCYQVLGIVYADKKEYNTITTGRLYNTDILTYNFSIEDNV